MLALLYQSMLLLTLRVISLQLNPLELKVPLLNSLELQSDWTPASREAQQSLSIFTCQGLIIQWTRHVSKSTLIDIFSPKSRFYLLVWYRRGMLLAHFQEVPRLQRKTVDKCWQGSERNLTQCWLRFSIQIHFSDFFVKDSLPKADGVMEKGI